MHDYTYL